MKYKIFLLAPLMLLMTSCFECLEPDAKSHILFKNTDEVGISMATLSKYSDSLDREPLLISEFAQYRSMPGRRTGPETLLSGTEALVLEGTHYILWLNANREIVAVWDLAEDSPADNRRWLNPSQWTMDSSICTVCNDMIQTHYTNTFTFDSTDLVQVGSKNLD